MKKSKAPAAPAPKTLTDKEIADRNRAALARVEEMDEPDKLRNLMANADRMGVGAVGEAAFRRLALIQAAEGDAEPGSLEHDFWQTIFAYEQLQREARGRAARLTKTRATLTRSGAVAALESFASVTEEMGGFATLTGRGLSDMTGEAVILRHPSDFDDATREAASARLEAAGVDPATLAA